jgi:hypothetical protein
MRAECRRTPINTWHYWPEIFSLESRCHEVASKKCNFGTQTKEDKLRLCVVLAKCIFLWGLDIVSSIVRTFTVIIMILEAKHINHTVPTGISSPIEESNFVHRFINQRIQYPTQISHYLQIQSHPDKPLSTYYHKDINWLLHKAEECWSAT